jgi:hypothetical protein
MNENGLVVNTLESEHTVVHVLNYPENFWICGLHRYITIGGDAPLYNNMDIAYATYQLWIISIVILLMIHSQ